MHSGLLPSNHTPAIFPVEFISQLRGRRHCPHCYLNFGWLSVFFFFFWNLSRFPLIAFLHCCRLLCFPRVFHSILHYWEGIRLFTTLLHLLRCMCGHLLFAYATKRRGSAVSSFPFALIIIVGSVLIFLYLFLDFRTVVCLFVIKYLLILISGGCLITLSAIQLLPHAISLSVGILYL